MKISKALFVCLGSQIRIRSFLEVITTGWVGCCCLVDGCAGIAQLHNWQFTCNMTGSRFHSGVRWKGEGLPPSYFLMFLLIKSQERELNQHFFTCLWYQYPASSWEWKVQDICKVSDSRGSGCGMVINFACCYISLDLSGPGCHTEQARAWSCTTNTYYKGNAGWHQKHVRRRRVTPSCVFPEPPVQSSSCFHFLRTVILAYPSVICSTRDTYATLLSYHI